MNILELVQEKISDSGFGGLYNSVMGCGCGADNLAPCGNIDPIECKFGYYHSTPCEKCDAICHQKEFDYVICGEV